MDDMFSERMVVMLKNTYVTGYFPLISIVLFSTSLGIYLENEILTLLKQFGLYKGILSFFSAGGIRLALFFLASLFFFMLFSALKLIADTLIQLSLLFFSKDRTGASLQTVRAGSFIYLVGGALSLFGFQNVFIIVGVFLITTFIYLMYFVYKIYASLNWLGTMGMIVFHMTIWAAFLIAVFLVMLRLYNSLMASLNG